MTTVFCVFEWKGCCDQVIDRSGTNGTERNGADLAGTKNGTRNGTVVGRHDLVDRSGIVPVVPLKVGIRRQKAAVIP